MELTMSSLVKLIIGILVFVAVVIGVSLIFKDKIIDLFSGISADNLGNAILLSAVK